MTERLLASESPSRSTVATVPSIQIQYPHKDNHITLYYCTFWLFPLLSFSDLQKLDFDSAAHSLLVLFV